MISSTIINAQQDHFIIGDDEINVISSSLNKKIRRMSFTMDENIYLKFISDRPLHQHIKSVKNPSICILVEIPSIGLSKFIYPPYKDDHWTSKSVTFVLKSDQITHHQIIDTRKEFDSIFQNTKFTKGTIKLSLVIVNDGNKIIKPLSTRIIKIK